MLPIRIRNVSWLLLSLCILAVDLLSKQYIISKLQESQGWAVSKIFNIQLLHNTGGAFSLLYHAGGWQRLFFIIVSSLITLALIAWVWNLKQGQRLEGFSLSFIIGGALGNLINRISNGYVVDFIDWHIGSWHWPVFNLADVTISIGVFLLVLKLLLESKKSEEELNLFKE